MAISQTTLLFDLIKTASLDVTMTELSQFLAEHLDACPTDRELGRAYPLRMVQDLLTIPREAHTTLLSDLRAMFVPLWLMETEIRQKLTEIGLPTPLETESLFLSGEPIIWTDTTGPSITKTSHTGCPR